MYIDNSQTHASLRSRRHQRGAAAIEFALLFMIFFVVFYALVSYALPITMLQAFHHAAAAGARAAVAVDQTAFPSNGGAYATAVEGAARAAVVPLLGWLPNRARNEVLSDVNRAGAITFVPGTGRITVRVRYPNYHNNPLMPILILPGFGEVQRLPQHLVGEASLQL